MHVRGLRLWCETPAASGPSHDSPRTPNVHIGGSRRFKHHQNSTRNPNGKRKRTIMREKKAPNFGPLHPLGPHPSGPHPSALFLRPRTLRPRTLRPRTLLPTLRPPCPTPHRSLLPAPCFLSRLPFLTLSQCSFFLSRLSFFVPNVFFFLSRLCFLSRMHFLFCPENRLLIFSHFRFFLSCGVFFSSQHQPSTAKHSQAQPSTAMWSPEKPSKQTAQPSKAKQSKVKLHKGK